MIEVIRALSIIEGKSLDDVINAANKKSEKRGAFEKKIFLKKVLTRDVK